MLGNSTVPVLKDQNTEREGNLTTDVLEAEVIKAESQFN